MSKLTNPWDWEKSAKELRADFRSIHIGLIAGVVFVACLSLYQCSQSEPVTAWVSRIVGL